MKLSRKLLSLENNIVIVILMIFISSLTQLISLTRISIIAERFGTDTMMDAYNMTLQVAVFFFSFISSGITIVVIPAYISKKNKRDVNSFVNLMYVFSAFMMLVILLLRNFILTFLSDSNQFTETVNQVIWIIFLSQFLITVQAVLSSFFYSENYFNIPKFLTLLSTTVLLVLMLLNKEMSIVDYAKYQALSIFLNTGTQMIFALKLGYRMSFCLDIKAAEVIRMVKIFIPTVVSSGLYQLTLLVDSLIAVRLGDGMLSLLAYANAVINMLNTVVIMNIIDFVYPKLTSGFTKNEQMGQRKLFSYIVLINMLMIVLLVGYFVVGEAAVILLFEHGKFSAMDSNIVYLCIGLYLFGFPVNMTRDLFYRCFYISGYTKATFSNSVVASMINLIFSIILIQFVGIYGVVLGTVVSSFVSLTMILIKFKLYYILDSSWHWVVTDLLKIGTGGLITFVLMLIIKLSTDLEGLWSILVYGCLVVSIYGGYLLVIRKKLEAIKWLNKMSEV